MQDDDSVSNPRENDAPTFQEILERRISRRNIMNGAMKLGAGVMIPGALGATLAGCADQPEPESPESTQTDVLQGSFNFEEIPRGMDANHHVPTGYEAEVLIRWGDPLFSDSPVFDPSSQTAEAQAKQFGYNCDFVGFFPLPSDAGEGQRGLLCVNHEFTSTLLMFPDVAQNFPASMTEALCEVEMAAHGGSVVEIVESGGSWRVKQDSPFNRRVMGYGTPMVYSGPAAGSSRLSVDSDPAGMAGTGTINNCAGGMTPWGTYLMAEENIHGYFQGEVSADHAESENHARYGVPGGWFQWGRFNREFNVGLEPNAPNRYGWVVEVDIMRPDSKPKKRTALGRLKHEGAETVIASDGRLVVYMGDDERFEYVYKFVTTGKYDANNREANLDLLDEGTLYVARFNEDGTLVWLPLVHGKGPLIAENGFDSQGDVVIEARRAADLLGATPMDRPEDVEAQPDTGRAYVMLTNNTRRQDDQVDSANPRANNAYGHIVEIVTPDGDHTAEAATWEVLILCGDPEDPAVGASWNAATSENGWFGSPDNCAFDAAGRLWVSTDGNPATGAADGVWAIETDRPMRGTGRAFFRAPAGAEVCGPRFTPDSKTLFVAVQHPGDGPQATYANPTTRWPDFDPAVPPRPSVVAIKTTDGTPIG